MRTQMIVVEAPTRDDLPRFGQIQECMLIQALVPESAVEAFNVSVLHRLARLDIMPSHPAWNPPENGYTSQFGAVIADNDLGLAPLQDELFEFAHHADAAERSIDHGRQAFAAEVINDAEDAEAPPVTASVRE